MVDSVPVTTRCLPVVPHSMTATGVSSFFPACRKFSQIVGKFLYPCSRQSYRYCEMNYIFHDRLKDLLHVRLVK